MANADSPESHDPGTAPHVASDLMPAVYEQLRRLAVRLIARERPGQTLQATALVHEAYLRLSKPLADVPGPESDGQAPTSPKWANRQHFFLVAAETMRHILVDSSRRKRARKRGGDRERLDVQLEQVADAAPPGDALALDEAITRLAAVDASAAELVRHYYFSSMTVAEAAATMQLSVRTAERLLAYARAWLVRELVL